MKLQTIFPLLALATISLFSCKKKTETPLIDFVTVNGKTYNIYSVPKDTYVPSGCTGGGIIGGITINAANGTDSVALLVFNLKNFSGTYQMYSQGVAANNCKFRIIGSTYGKGVSQKTFYSSNEGTFKIEPTTFSFEGAKFYYPATPTDLFALECSGKY